MAKIIKLTESDLRRIVERTIDESEQNEGPIDYAKNVYSGLKGVWRGEGYDYFKYLNSLHTQVKNLQRLDKPNQKVISELSNLKSKISSAKMNQQKKQRIIGRIDQAINQFTAYQNTINRIESIVKQELN